MVKPKTMPETDPSQGLVAAFISLVGLLGAIVGGIVGYVLAGAVHDHRLLALVSAFVAVIAISLARRFLAKLFPVLSLGRPGVGAPAHLWLSICFAAIIGGLAGHDLGEWFGAPWAALEGFIAGLFAAMAMATLMSIYFHAHHKKGVEF
jgi:uncharacterized membrane protein YeaQ/YmgE (transglycosylase-associated protein family)